MSVSAPLEDVTISEQHSIDHVLSDEELNFLGQLYSPRKRRFPWRQLLFYVLLAAGAVATFCYAFSHFSVAIDHKVYSQQQVIYTQAPTKAVLDATQALPAGSVVAYFEEQWVACTPLEDGWQCQGLPIPSS